MENVREEKAARLISFYLVYSFSGFIVTTGISGYNAIGLLLKHFLVLFVEESISVIILADSEHYYNLLP